MRHVVDGRSGDDRPEEMIGMDVIERLENAAPPVRESLADQVATILKRFMIVEDLAPGSRMPTERRLADTLNVSRTVLREALSRLIGEGLLVRASPRVLQVAAFDRERLVASMSPFDEQRMHFRDLLELRYILEMGALPVIIRKITPEAAAEIEHWADEFERQLHSGNPVQATDAKFHASLLRSLDNATVNNLLPLLEDQFREYLLLDPRLIGGHDVVSDERVVREHREIVDAIRARDPIAAVSAMERHLAPYFQVIQELGRASEVMVEA